MTISYIIRLLRHAQGLTQSEMADRLNVSRPYLSALESGKVEPGMSVLKRISQELEIPLGVLVSLDDKGAAEFSKEAREFLADLVKGIVLGGEDQDQK